MSPFIGRKRGKLPSVWDVAELSRERESERILTWMFWQLSAFLRGKKTKKKKTKISKRNKLFWIFFTCIILKPKCCWRANYRVPVLLAQPTAGPSGNQWSIWSAWWDAGIEKRPSQIKNIHTTITVWIKPKQKQREDHPTSAEIEMLVSLHRCTYSKNRPVNWISVVLSHLQPAWK